MVSFRTSFSNGVSRIESFAPVRMAASAINIASSAITSMSASIAMSKVGLGGMFVAAAVTALGSLGCGRFLLDDVLEGKPTIAQTPLTDSGLDVVNVDAEAGLPEADAGIDGDALVNPDVIDAAEAEADAIILPDAPDADEADAPINPDALEAGDGDANPVDVVDGDVIQPDADGAVCVPFNFNYKNFNPTTGTYTNTEAVNGAIQLQEDETKWTGIYDASKGFLPDDINTVPQWAKYGSFVAPSPNVSTGSLFLNTLGSNAGGYYSVNTNFDNSLGYAIDINLKLNGEDDATFPDEYGFSVISTDGTKYSTIAFVNGCICDPEVSKNCYQIATGISNYHLYRIIAKGADFKVYVDNVLGLDGTGYLLKPAGGYNNINVGDGSSNPDSSTNIKFIRWYSLGTNPPHKSTGTYQHGSTADSAIIDFDWSGVQLGWNNTGTGTSSIAIRTGNTPADLSAAPFSSEFTIPGAISSGYTGKLLQWRLTEATSGDTPVVPEVSFNKDCADK
ncbi:MAG: hypothetical protein WC624_07055 [Candidatus Margulisiibacteriota bacterium]